nr:hypothetical protein [Tanacetum cinerariifolium]
RDALRGRRAGPHLPAGHALQNRAGAGHARPPGHPADAAGAAGHRAAGAAAIRRPQLGRGGRFGAAHLLRGAVPGAGSAAPGRVRPRVSGAVSAAGGPRAPASAHPRQGLLR